ncbi:inositol monophosphatase family protein [Rhizobium sp. S152]|uniref:inositol monophosphatase family protein n=1 Tax=Rhizobium sp. S152 TaxID=3055038 RepID=UPI0025A9BD31|nr:inositol monophosphatase family protein [Rhizobium sp. S152]MDM9625047.1 inositol monophosphatase family protein [Rhizobium sp. S152]
MKDDEIDHLFLAAKEAARAGGAELLSRFGRLGADAVNQKGHADYVSEADTAAEVAILKVLNETAAGYGFLGEETGYHAGEKTETWVVDPLDGTSNFVWGIPYFAVSIALCDESGEVLGVVFDPIRDEMFSAVRGRGAWVNDVRVPALAAKPPESAMVSISMPVPGQLRCIAKGQFLVGLQTIMDRAAGVRRLGSAALDLAYVGSGRLDGYFEDGLSYYDLAAGKLFALEAGAAVTNFEGGIAREGSVVAGQRSLHSWLASVFQ